MCLIGVYCYKMIHEYIQWPKENSKVTYRLYMLTPIPNKTLNKCAKISAKLDVLAQNSDNHGQKSWDTSMITLQTTNHTLHCIPPTPLPPLNVVKVLRSSCINRRLEPTLIGGGGGVSQRLLSKIVWDRGHGRVHYKDQKIKRNVMAVFVIKIGQTRGRWHVSKISFRKCGVHGCMYVSSW